MMPINSIILWYDSIANIPAGWVLCDGANGTPDLRNKFIKGVSTDTDKGGQFGSSTHVHTNQSTVVGGDHNHSIQVTLSGNAGGLNYVAEGGSQVAAGNGHQHSGSVTSENSGTHSHTVLETSAGNSLPPFIQVYFIMKVA